MTIERCDFCRRELGAEEPRHAYRLGLASLLHCDRPKCRAHGKEWRVQRLRECAGALGLVAKGTVRAEVSKHDPSGSPPQE